MDLVLGLVLLLLVIGLVLVVDALLVPFLVLVFSTAAIFKEGRAALAHRSVEPPEVPVQGIVPSQPDKQPGVQIPVQVRLPVQKVPLCLGTQLNSFITKCSLGLREPDQELGLGLAARPEWPEEGRLHSPRKRRLLARLEGINEGFRHLLQAIVLGSVSTSRCLTASLAAPVSTCTSLGPLLAGGASVTASQS